MRGITFIGAGALAQGIAAHLSAHVPVTLVASERTGADLRAKGAVTVGGLSRLHAELSDGNAVAPGRLGLQLDPARVSPDDALIFTTKGPQLAGVVRQVPRGRNSLVAGLQNGVLKDEILMARFGAENVVGAVTLFNARREGADVIIGGKGYSYFGELSGGSSARVAQIVDLFRRADLNAAVSDSIRSLTWMKFVNALGVFGTSALTRKTSTAIMQSPSLVAAYLDLIGEGAAVAVAEGAVVADYPDIPMGSYVLRDPDRVATEIVTAARAAAAGPGSLSSMAQDVLAGRPTESAETFGDIVERAERRGIPAPRLRFVRDLLAGFDSIALGASAENDIAPRIDRTSTDR
ncbi:ketopantoate reductase family protein [Microbacterium sp. 179-I 3D2 NHS]|uniref:ketopantoate reductase family protein n=1 Tax=Microbacterium sp. 179-I 3D2 NHS TaxID=3235178 RepID=UPI00399F7872